MSIQTWLFRLGCARSDRKRDSAIPLPEGVACRRDISYGPYGKSNLLDVYTPEGTAQPLCTVVSIHGGGYIYGTKEIYRRYGMDIARRGFAFVNFNYRLAPKWKFPTPLEDTNAVMRWICEHAEAYHLDPKRLILVGDSAGAQLASQYAAIATNEDYAKKFPFSVPPIRICAVGLNCGMYDPARWTSGTRKGFARDYLGDLPAEDPRMRVLEAITPDYPPAYLATACHDFLRAEAQPMADFLSGKGIETVVRCYGSEDNEAVAHVFHVNIVLPEAVACNDDECAFFREKSACFSPET